MATFAFAAFTAPSGSRTQCQPTSSCGAARQPRRSAARTWSAVNWGWAASTSAAAAAARGAALELAVPGAPMSTQTP